MMRPPQPEDLTMNRIDVSALLRFGLRLDAAASAATGLLLAALPGRLSALFGLPADLLLGAGLFCVGYAALIAFMSTRRRLPAAGVWAVVIGNLGWAAGCVELALAAGQKTTPIGIGFLVVQAVAVVLFAEIQFLGLRRSPVAAAALA
jgi:hypothetical protein